METQSAFNLSEALDHWRDALRGQSLGAEEIEELESHLLETIGSLKGEKLSSTEAFLVAGHRVGRPEMLGEQFGLAKPLERWKQRGVWMLTGVLLFWIAGAIANLGAHVTLIVGNRWTGDGLRLGFIGLGVQALIILLSGGLLWRGIRSGHFTRVKGRGFAKPVLSLFAGVIILRLCDVIFSAWAATSSSPRTLGGFYMILSGGSRPLVVLALGALAGGLSWKTRRQQIMWSVIMCGSLMSGGCSPEKIPAESTQANAPRTAGSSRGTPLETSLQLAKDSPVKGADEFMKVDLANAPLFSPGSPLSYSEVKFIQLPREVNEKLAQQAQDELAVLKKIVAEIKTRRDKARTAGKAELSQQYNAQLEKLATLLEGPNNLAITQMVGKAVRKVAAQ